MTNRFSLRHRCLARAIWAAVVAAPLFQPAWAAELNFDPQLAKAPPEASLASLELLSKPTASGNALLRVQFTDKRSKTSIVIQGGPAPTLLRDDGVAPDARAGDGVYTAVVKVNAGQFGKEQSRRILLAREFKTLPNFKQRQLVGYSPFQPSQNAQLRPGLATVLDRFTGVPFVVDPERELLVRDLLVVEDPARTYEPCTGAGTQMGAWTFGRLVTEMANQAHTGIDPAVFAENWVNQWKTDLNINGFTVWQRAIGAQDLLDMWPKLPDGKLDLGQAPFRLLAIVNRQDLRGSALYGSGAGGEARLVFGAVRCHPTPDRPPTQAMPFTVIFEYAVPANNCPSARNWAVQWQALGALPLGSAAYNAALQAITDQFTLRDADPTRLPNRSAINQVRTNEFALADFPVDSFWELRESRLIRRSLSAGQLMHRTVAQTPDSALQFTATLRDYVNDNAASILGGSHVVPPTYPAGSPFQGGHIQPGAGAGWNAAGILNLEARHKFSLATCNGCHTAETRTSFLHIAPRNVGAVTVLSDFLTGAGMPKTDPVTGVPRTFHDLLDRQMKLDATANMVCIKADDFPVEEIFLPTLPWAFVH